MGRKRCSSPDQKLVKQLVAAGRPMPAEIDQELEDNNLPVDIQVIDNFVFDSYVGGSAHYAVRVRLIAKAPNVVITDCEITSPWDPDITLEYTYGKGLLHKFSGQEFLRAEILNERLEDGLRFRYRGQVAEGWLLASGLARIPSDVGHCACCEMSFVDSLGRTLRVKADVSVERSNRRVPKEGLECKPGLYAGPPERSIGEQMRLRYLEILAQKRGELWAAERGRCKKRSESRVCYGKVGTGTADWLRRLIKAAPI